MKTNYSAYNQVYISGSVAYDVIMNFPGEFKDHFHSELLHQINISFVVVSLQKHLGGTATNIAYNLSLVTAKQKVLLGAVGKDHARLSSFFEKHAIDSSLLYRDEKLYTSTGSVITDMVDNQIWGYYYGAAQKSNLVKYENVNHENSIFIISANHESGFLTMQDYCIEHSLPYLYDPGMCLTWIKDEVLHEGIRNCTFLVGNDYEITQICKRLDKEIEEFVKEGVNVVTTLGERGVRYQSEETHLEIPGFELSDVVDPTGAGDAWRGGFVGYLLEGKQIEECLARANALASFAVETKGTVNHKPNQEEIDERYRRIIG